MKKHIIALMNEGITLDQIQSEVEKIFNEEYKKREAEQERAKRYAAMNAALNRASAAVVDFINGYVGEEVLTVKECRSALRDTAVKVKMENTVTQPADEDEDIDIDVDVDEQKLVDFLISMGLIQPK